LNNADLIWTKPGIVGRAGANSYAGATKVIKLAVPSVEDLTAG